jgi:hypothetical protein
LEIFIYYHQITTFPAPPTAPADPFVFAICTALVEAVDGVAYVAPAPEAPPFPADKYPVAPDLDAPPFTVWVAIYPLFVT